MKLATFFSGAGNKDIDPDTAIMEEDLETLQALDPVTTTASMTRPRHWVQPPPGQARTEAVDAGPAALDGSVLGFAGARTDPGADEGGFVAGPVSGAGARSFRDRLKVAVPLVGGAIVAAFALLGIDARQSSDRANGSLLVGDALVQSQSVAKATPLAINGNPEALSQLQQARDDLAAASPH